MIEVRTGNTEMTMAYILFLESRNFFVAENIKLFWINYMRTAGYFEGRNDQVIITSNMRNFIERYIDSLKMAKLYIMSITIEKFKELNDSHVEDFLESLGASEIVIRQSADYNIISKLCEHKKVFVVSSFAPLMIKQWQTGNLKKIRPTFNPSLIEGYRFPYLYNSLEYESSNQALDTICEDLAPHVANSDVVILSCGVYGGFMSSFINQLGKDVFYVGGDLQIWFGIMGARWRNSVGRQQDFIDSSEYWITKIPEDYVYSNSSSIEGSCYW
jgi:hypothetical protein